MCNDHRHRIIRYSEVLLWYAEAKARTGQTDELAFKCLNDVRKRAGLEPLTGLSADDLAEAAYKEQNTAVEVADGIQVKESVEYTNRTWSDNLMYLPYPDMDSQKNPNLVR